MRYAHRTNSARDFLLLCLVFLSALIIRIQYIHPLANDIFLARDAKEYVAYGWNLAERGTFSKDASPSTPRPDSYRSPGYPTFIALFLLGAGGENYLKWLIYAQAIMGALLAPLIFLTGRFFLPVAGATVSALLTAFSPHLITTTGCILSETLFGFLLLAAVCCLQYAFEKPTAWCFAVSAILFGCAYLTNEASLFVPYLLAIVGFLLSAYGDTIIIKRGFAGRMVAFLIIFTLFPTGWMVRNQISVPAGAPKASDRAVVTMSHGAYPDFIYKSLYYRRFPYREDPMQPAFGASIEGFSSVLWSRAKENPGLYIRWYLVGKPYYLWSWDIIQGIGDIYINPVKVSLFEVSVLGRMIKGIMKSIHPLILLLALLSLPTVFFRWVKSRNRTGHLCNLPVLPLSICIYFTALYTIFAPWPRYSVPLRPELYLCAVWVSVSLISIIGGKWRPNHD
jgi:hypothetical protein